MQLGSRCLALLLAVALCAVVAGCDAKNPVPISTATPTSVAPSTPTVSPVTSATRTASNTATAVPATATPVPATSTPIDTATPEATATAPEPSATTTANPPTTSATPTTTATATATETPASTETASPLPTSSETPAETPAGSARIITTIVGNGVAGLNGDGLAGQKTALYLPQDMTIGPDGLLYFSDWNNHRIRRIKDGVVETIAGTGELGSAHDGLALEAQFNHPVGITFDAQGRMIIAAWHNSEVKRIDLTTGIMENLIGTGGRSFGGDEGPGNAAILDLPSSVVVDTNGDIIVSDQANFRIRLLEPNGVIHTICGNGTQGYSGDGGRGEDAQLNSPVGQAAPPVGRIAIDSHNRIYIADTGNNVIRLLDVNGFISTIVGNGTQGYSGDGGPATAAQLNSPSDVAVAPDGTIYIADTFNQVIRSVTPDGIIHTVAGTGERGFSGDGGAADQAKLDRPYGVAVGPDGSVYIADTHNQRIRRLTPTLPSDYDPNAGGGTTQVDVIPCTDQVGSICTFAGDGEEGFNGDGLHRLQTAMYWPFDIEFAASGRTYVVDWNNHKVRQLMPDQTFKTVIGTDFIGDGPDDLSDQTAPGAPGTTVNLNHPTDVQELPNGDLALMAWHNHKIRMYYPDTGLVRVMAGAGAGFRGDGGPAKQALVNQPPHGALDSHGNLFFIDQRNQRIRVLYDFANQREQAIIQTVVGTGVQGFNGDGVALQTMLNFPAGGNPEPSGGIAVDANGTLYFSDSNNNRIRRVDFSNADFTEGVVTTIAGDGTGGFSGDGGPAKDAEIYYPEDLEVGPDGNLYFADTDNHRVRMIDMQTGIISTIAGTGVGGYSGDGGMAKDAQLLRPFGVAFDQNGDLYIADTFNSRIRRVKLTDTKTIAEPIFPADYRATFTEVRNCRFSIAHGGVSVRVLANPIAADPYLNDANPLPVGSIVIKEEYAGPSCDNDADLIGWRVMRKEDPGYDPQDGDWHWQHLNAERQVLYNTKATCIGCHVAPECLARDHMCTVNDTVKNPPLSLVLQELPAALLSISGKSSHDMYAVGADPGDGTGPMVLHYNGINWERLLTGQSGNLWWITITPIDGSFYMAGENGMILRYDPATRVFERQTTPGTPLLYGIWGDSASDLWAVGGDPANDSTGGVVWHYDGTEWTAQDLSGVRAEGIPTLFKVWGRNQNDVWASGRLGIILHWDGTSWNVLNSSAELPLFTISGNATEVISTGGFLTGSILELDGTSFVDRAPAGTPQMNGVFVRTDGTAIAAGNEGSVAFRDSSGWTLQDPPVNTLYDFHAAWGDSEGGLWAVGGDLVAGLKHGILAYGGSETVGTQIVDADPCAPGGSNPNATVSYQNDIAPLFDQVGCTTLGCHGGGLNSSGFDLSSFASSFTPGDEASFYGICPIQAGNPDASYLIEKISNDMPRNGVRMPNGLDPLTPAQIELVRTWIMEGAPNN